MDPNNLHGLEFDRGSVRGTWEEERSQKTVAVNERFSLTDMSFAGFFRREVRLIPNSTDYTYDLDQMANKRPELQLKHRRFKDAMYPSDALADLDALLNAVGSTYHADCIVVRPVTSVIASSYERNTSFSAAVAGSFSKDPFIGPSAAVLAPAPYYNDFDLSEGRWELFLPEDWESRNFSKDEWYVDAQSVTLVAGSAFSAADRGGTWALALVPIKQGGAVPVLIEAPEISKLLNAATDRKALMAQAFAEGKRYKVKSILKWAVVYQQDGVELTSPLRTMIASDALCYLLDYLSGEKRSAGQYDFKRHKTTPIQIVGRLLSFMLNKAAQSYIFTPSKDYDTTPEAELVRAITDFAVAWRYKDLIKEAVATRTEAQMFYRMLLFSGLQPAVVAGTITAPQVDTEFAQWLFTSIVQPIMASVRPGFLMKQYKTGLTDKADNSLAEQLLRGDNEEAMTMAKTTSLFRDMTGTDSVFISPEFTAGAGAGPDYVASYLLESLARSLPVILKALRGEMADMPVIQYKGDNYELDITVSILEALNYAVNMDVESNAVRMQFTLPYKRAFWQTNFASISCAMALRPIRYGVIDMAQALSDKVEGKLDVSAPLDGGLLESLSAVFDYAGYSHMRYGPDLNYLLTLDGVERPQAKSDLLWYTNAPMTHQAVEVYKVMPMWDKDSWMMMMEAIRSYVPKSYFPMPVTPAINRLNLFKVDPKKTAAWIPDLVSMLTGTPKQLPKVTYSYITVPALADVAMIVPYIREFESHPLEANDIVYHHRIDISDEHSNYDLTGTVVIPDATPLAAVNPESAWMVPSLNAGFSYVRSGSGRQSEPLLWTTSR